MRDHSVPFTVIGEYRPTEWKAYKVGRDICRITRQAGLVPLVDPVHGPQTWTPWHNEELHAEVKKRSPRNPKGEDWHQDGDLDPGSVMDHALVLWATNTPTQFRVGSDVYQPKPYSIVVARNLGSFHRRPPDAPRVRWLFRQRVVVPAWLK